MSGGGGGPSSTTVTQSNVPDWLRPQVEGLLSAAAQELFSGTTSGDGFTISGPKPYTPYSQRGSDYVAQMNPMQLNAMQLSNWLGSQEGGQQLINEQYGRAADFSSRAGWNAEEAARQALGFGQTGAGYGASAAGLAPLAQQYAQQASGMGDLYERMATSPEEYQRFMSPYMQNVVAQQQSDARRQADISAQQRGAAAARAGAFGGGRQAIENAEANRALQSQLQGIQAQGLQNAYQQAQGNILNRAQLGLQGLAGGQQGLGQAGQLYGVGMQGAGVGLQGVQGALGGYGQMGQAGMQLADITGRRLQDVMGTSQFQYALGEQQRQLEQRAIDQQVQNWAMAQEMPFNRLAQFSALLRGYATPGQTISQYQASSPLGSQLAGLSLTGLGLSGMSGGGGRKAGGMVRAGDGIDTLALNRAKRGG